MLPSPQPRYTTEGPEGVDDVVAVIDGATVAVVDADGAAVDDVVEFNGKVNVDVVVADVLYELDDVVVKFDGNVVEVEENGVDTDDVVRGMLVVVVAVAVVGDGALPKT